MKITRWTVLAVATVLMVGCFKPPVFKVSGETPQSPVLKPYSHLYVGWVALPEDDWKKYGFVTKEDWVAKIRIFNTTGLQAYIRDRLRDAQVSGPEAQEQGLPVEGDLYIKFTFHSLSGQNEPFELNLGVEFIDLATRETVYRTDVGVDSYGVRNRGVKQMYFYGQLDNAMYNLAYFINERLRG